jgi:RNA polymerase sigma-70 factor (ECF subfamily)
VSTDLDSELLRTLYDEHADALWGYCLHLSRGARDGAEDLAQETLIRAWRHPAVLEMSSGSVRAWLFRVAHNLAIDQWRSRSVRPESSVDPRTLHRVVDDGTDALLQSWLVADALRSLTPEHRGALVECYYEGRTVADAARRLGVPDGTVSSRLHYGLKALRLALEERGVTG